MSGGAYLPSIVQKIEQSLLEQNRIQLEHRHIGRKLDLDLMVRQDLCGARQGASDHFAQILKRGLGHNRA